MAKNHGKTGRLAPVLVPTPVVVATGSALALYVHLGNMAVLPDRPESWMSTTPCGDARAAHFISPQIKYVTCL